MRFLCSSRFQPCGDIGNILANIVFFVGITQGVETPELPRTQRIYELVTLIANGELGLEIGLLTGYIVVYLFRRVALQHRSEAARVASGVLT
jgi:hypothetical protein